MHTRYSRLASSPGLSLYFKVSGQSLIITRRASLPCFFINRSVRTSSIALFHDIPSRATNFSSTYRWTTHARVFQIGKTERHFKSNCSLVTLNIEFAKKQNKSTYSHSWRMVQLFFFFFKGFRSDEGLTLETSTSLFLYWGNLTLINLFDTKISVLNDHSRFQTTI